MEKSHPFFFFFLSNDKNDKNEIKKRKGNLQKGFKVYHKVVLNIREKFYAARGVVMVEFLFRTR